MKCPHCQQTLPFLVCPQCGRETPEGSLYCSQCGSPIKQENVREEVDFSERRLCTDGTCIGVINERGICNICGKPYAGEPT